MDNQENKVVEKSLKELQECKDAQAELCRVEDFPHFAPVSGRCYKCGRNIYQNYLLGSRESNGYDGKTFVTGCPHCHRSFCD